MNRRPRISILSHRGSGNALGRAHVLAELVAPRYEVEVVAADPERGELWAPLAGEVSYPVHRWYVKRIPGLAAAAPRVAREYVTGDLIIAVKPRLPSFGLGLWAQRQHPRPLILDIDAHEVGLSSGREYDPLELLNANGDAYARLLLAQRRRADAITVSNRDLYRRYGGIWLPHARDESRFSAEPPPTDLPPVVLFAGTWRPHKGVETLLDAFGRLRHRSARLQIVGAVAPAADLPKGVTLSPPTPMRDLPAILERASCVVIPSSAGPASEGQLPAKLIDAMAAGRPIVATAVGDMPAWLADGAGRIVPPGDPVALASAIDQVLEDRDAAHRMGKRARDRFRRLASSAVLSPRLCDLVQALLDGRRPPDDLEPFATEAPPSPSAMDD